MKKTVSAILSLSLAVSALPITAVNAVTEDLYFTDGVRTIDYDTEWCENAWTGMDGASQTGDSAYKFTVGNENFSLLDVSQSDINSKYFVIANQIYGTYPMPNTTRANVFECAPGLEGTHTYWVDYNLAPEYPTFFLNSAHFYNAWTFRDADTSVPQIADNIRAYIDTDHVWTCEPASKAGVSNAKYTFKAGITLPSASEVNTYKDRFGIGEYNEFATRTSISYTWDGNTSLRFLGVAQDWYTDQWYPKQTDMTGGIWYNIRPCFWLKDGFFANVKVDLATAGDAVKQEIKKVGYVGLLSIYTRDEIENQLGLYPEGGILATVSTRSSNAAAYGETLIADYEYLANDGFVPVSSNITWKKTEGNTTTVLGSGSTYVVKEPDAAVDGTRIFFDITLTGADGSTRSTTSAAAVIAGLGVGPVSPNTSVIIKTAADAADTFMVGDKAFTLLDSFDNDESTFFVAANDNYGTMTMDVPWMDTTDMSNYGYWFDNEFKNQGNDKDTGGVVKKLPDGIVSYINNNHEWLTEGAPENASAYYGDYLALDNDYYTYKAGVAPISVHEIHRYSSVLGSTDNIGGGYLTRTAVNWRDTSNDMVSWMLHANITKDAKGNDIIFFSHWNLPAASNIRPVFYLTKDFFKNVQLDWDMIGSNVKAAMAKMYYIEDLEHLYDSFNLEDAGFKHRPQSSMNVTFSSYGNPTDVLSALSGAASLQANVTYTSVDSTVDAKLVLAVYDEAGNLVKVAMNDIKSNTNTAEGSVGIAALEGITASHEAKLMIWDNLSSCKPVEKAVLFNSEAVLTPATAVTKLSSSNRGNNFFEVSRFV